MAESSHAPHAPDAHAVVLSTAVLDAERWLQDELLEERAAINRLVEARHRELLVKFAAKLSPHLVHSGDGGPDEAGRKPASQQATSYPELEQEQQDTTVDDASRPVPLVALPLSSQSTESVGSDAKADGAASPTGSRRRPADSWLQATIKSTWFEILFGILIIANAVVMGMQRQYQGHVTAYQLGYQGFAPPAEAWPNAESIFGSLEWFFGCAFTMEMLLKLVILRKKFFTDTLWNIFDLVVVSVWLIDRVALSFLNFDATVLRMARVVRLTRLLRVMGWVQFLDPLILMVKSIKASTTILIWSLIMMMIFISTVAMGVSAMLEPFTRDEATPLPARIAVYQSWGSYTRAMETMMEITLTNFGPAAKLLMNEVDEMWAWFFLSYKMTVGFAVIQVIISVFIQQTFKIASRDEEVMIKEKAAAANSYAKNLDSLFAYLDESGDGLLSRDEFNALCHDKRVKTWFAALEVEAVEVSDLFDLLDDGDGVITHDEFLHGVKALKGGAKGTDMLMLARNVKKNWKVIGTLQEKMDLMSHKFIHVDAALMRRPTAELDDDATI